MGLDIARYSGGFCSRFVLSSVRCVISLTTDHSVGKNPLCRRGLHISSCQLCLRMGTIETCFGKILTASRAPLTRYTSPIPPATTVPELISGNLLGSLLPTITSGLPIRSELNWAGNLCVCIVRPRHVGPSFMTSLRANPPAANIDTLQGFSVEMTPSRRNKLSNV